MHKMLQIYDRKEECIAGERSSFQQYMNIMIFLLLINRVPAIFPTFALRNVTTKNRYINGNTNF